MGLEPREEQEGFYLLLAWKWWVPWHRFRWQVIVTVGSVEEGLSALAVPRKCGVKHQPGGRTGLRVQRAPTWGRAIFHIKAGKESRQSLVTWALQRTVCIHREFTGAGHCGPGSPGKALQRALVYRTGLGYGPSHFVQKMLNSTDFTYYLSLLVINSNPKFGPKGKAHDLSAAWPTVTDSEWEARRRKKEKTLLMMSSSRGGHLAHLWVPDEDIMGMSLPSWKSSSSHKYQPH